MSNKCQYNAQNENNFVHLSRLHLVIATPATRAVVGHVVEVVVEGVVGGVVGGVERATESPWKSHFNTYIQLPPILIPFDSYSQTLIKHNTKSPACHKVGGLRPK